MAKGITKTQLVRLLAEKLELTNKQTAAFLETLAETAVKETKKTGEFTQGTHRSQSSDRRGHQDQGKDCR
jgi:uncharacterized tellurite resistance protein B-like protein